MSWEPIRFSASIGTRLRLLNSYAIPSTSAYRRGTNKPVAALSSTLTARMRPVAKIGGKVKQGRHRSAADYVQPDKPQLPPIVKQAIWDKVRAKLAAASTAREETGRRTANYGCVRF